MFFLKFLRTKTKLIYSSYFFLFLVFVFSTPLTTIAEDIPFLEKAVGYEVSNKTKFEEHDRSVIYVLIFAPSDLNFEQRAQTVLKAALDIHRDTNVTVVEVTLKLPELEGRGDVFARAYYSSDGESFNRRWKFKNGHWQVWASEAQFSTKTLEVYKMWITYVSSFKKAGGPGSTIVDIDRLGEFVAKKLNLENEEVLSIVSKIEISLRDWPQ